MEKPTLESICEINEIYPYGASAVVSHNCFYYTSKPECTIQEDIPAVNHCKKQLNAVET
jgi:hypothetical protein